MSTYSSCNYNEKKFNKQLERAKSKITKAIQDKNKLNRLQKSEPTVTYAYVPTKLK